MPSLTAVTFENLTSMGCNNNALCKILVVAVKAGPFVFVGGTTSVLTDKSVYGSGDSKLQDEFIWQKITDFSQNLHLFLMLYNL